MNTRVANAGVSTARVDVIGDGSCFFRAVLVALRLKNLSAFSMPEEEHHTLRQLVVQFASASSYCFNVYTTEYSGKDEWVREMSRPGVWADNIAVEACSDFLEIPIGIVSNGMVSAVFGRQYMSLNGYTGIDNAIRLELHAGHYSVIV